MKSPVRREAGDNLFDSYTLTHLAHRWHVSRRQIRQLLQQGKLPFVEIRGEIRVPRWAVIIREEE